jgi:hypothetical protein
LCRDVEELLLERGLSADHVTERHLAVKRHLRGNVCPSSQGVGIWDVFPPRIPGDSGP